MPANPGLFQEVKRGKVPIAEALRRIRQSEASTPASARATAPDEAQASANLVSGTRDTVTGRHQHDLAVRGAEGSDYDRDAGLSSIRTAVGTEKVRWVHV